MKSVGLIVTRYFLLMVMLSLSSCDEADVRISIPDEAVPRFAFKGNGYLDFFAVTELAPENNGSVTGTPKDRMIWQIFPETTENGTLPLSPIDYGKVPAGFVQRVPESGAPPPLVEGKLYRAGAPPIIHPRGFVHFMVKNGRLMAVNWR